MNDDFTMHHTSSYKIRSKLLEHDYIIGFLPITFNLYNTCMHVPPSNDPQNSFITISISAEMRERFCGCGYEFNIATQPLGN